MSMQKILAIFSWFEGNGLRFGILICKNRVSRNSYKPNPRWSG